MGWGPNPVDEAAAERAAAEARERLANRPYTPFERKLIEVLGDIREELERARPVELEPIIGTAEGLLGPVHVAADGVEVLLDADPTDLSLAVDAGATALYNHYPVLREDFTRAGFEGFAECVIEAALHQAAQSSAGQADARGEAAGGDEGDEVPPTSPEIPPAGSDRCEHSGDPGKCH